MEPKKIFSTSWTQPYHFQFHGVSFKELEALKELLIEQMLDAKDFKEADEVIAWIKSK